MKRNARAAAVLVLMALALTAALPAYAACPGFSVTPDYAAGLSPRASAAGDFNADGNIDIAFADYAGNSVATLLGNSNGSFATGYTIAGIGAQPTAIAAGDFNRDGRTDLALGHLSGSVFGSGVFILLSYGDGSFAPAVQNAIAGVPEAIKVADFNRDGRPDIAVANYVSGQPGKISVLLATGDGTFAPAVSYAVGSSPTALAVGDVNGDGKADLAVANATSSTVSILQGLGDGSFAPAVTYGVGSDPEAVALADLNSDGKPDVVVGNVGSADLSILLGDGSGGFSAAVSRPVGGGAHSIGIADFDGDGKADVAVATGVADGTGLMIFPGDGHGGIGAPATFYTGANPPFVLLIADFDADGRPDIATANFGSNTASVFLNNSICTLNCGTLAGPADESTGTSPQAAVVTDLNGDGKSDVVVANQTSKDVSVLLGDGTGRFAPAVAYAAGTSPAALTAADFDRDGHMDIAVANSDSSEVVILAGAGDGSLSGNATYAVGTGPRAIVSGDFNGDGVPDLAVADTGSDDVAILIGDGTGSFSAAATYPAGTSPRSLVTADIDRDGKLDLAVANGGSDDVSVFLGNGDGTFADAIAYPAGSSPSSIAVGDFDRDRRLDLAVTNAGSDTVSILLGNSGGTFASAVNYPAGAAPESALAVDLDGDGNMDLVVASHANDAVTILTGNGDGTVAVRATVPSTAGPGSVIAADFSSDGRADLVAVNRDADSISLFMNTCSAPDLTVRKSHIGDFKRGQSGAAYTITVTNSGQGRLAAGVSVTDMLPPALTATSISGSGWTCDLATLSCNRADELLPAASYPPLTVVVDVAYDAPALVTNAAQVVAADDIDNTNNSAADETAILDVPDLVLSKTHDGNFARGQSARTYSLVVRNGGKAATNAPVTLTDTLPAGLTAAALTGPGWSCDLATVTCVRMDTLAPASSYPAVTVTVDVAADAAPLVVNSAAVTGGGETLTSNNTASDSTTILIEPSNLTAIAISTSQVALNWGAVAGAARYQVLRSSNHGAAATVAFPITNSFIDVDLEPRTTYVYQVRATDSSNAGPLSNADVATTILFTDDPVISATTIIKAVHLTELQSAVNAVRIAAGLPTAVFSGTVNRGLPIKADDIQVLRANLLEARSALGLGTAPFADDPLAKGTTIKAVHVRELRDGVQ